MFKLSNVTGLGLDKFRNFLFLQDPLTNWEKNKRNKDSNLSDR